MADRARKKGVLLETCGPSDEVLKILAPLNIERELFHEGLRRVKAAIEERHAAASPSRYEAA